MVSGPAPERPIFAVRAGSRGDLSLPPGQTSSESIAWSRVRRGSYMPTPIQQRGILYVLENQGILSAYGSSDGSEIYRRRLAHGGLGFSASPVIADERLYLSSESGEIVVVRAGRELEILARNDMGEPLMATPALSEHTMVRARPRSSLRSRQVGRGEGDSMSDRGRIRIVVVGLSPGRLLSRWHTAPSGRLGRRRFCTQPRRRIGRDRW